jgi:hypothetical protein
VLAFSSLSILLYLPFSPFALFKEAALEAIFQRISSLKRKGNYFVIYFEDGAAWVQVQSH